MNYSTLTLQGTFHETQPPRTSPLSIGVSSGKAFYFDFFLLQVQDLLRRPKVGTVLVHCAPDFAPGAYAGAEAVREQLQLLVAGGKDLVFFAKEYGLLQLYLGSVATRRVIHPVGAVAALGLARNFTFLKQVLDRHKITATVVRAGRYKAAGDRFRVDQLDPFNQAQHEAILDTVMAEYSEKIAPGLSLEGRIFSAAEAVEAGWVNETNTWEDLLEGWKNPKSKNKEYKPRRLKPRFGSGAKIALLQFEGGIKNGENSRDFLMGQMIGSSTFIPLIQKLRKDKKIKGVIFRVNSGGGSALASEDISRELDCLGAAKPLVVSMSEVAGSGGYWIATGASRIFAHRTTITGSIGVISILFSIKEFLASHGITHSVIRRGEYSDLGSPYREPNEGDTDIISSYTNKLYSMFVQKVAQTRNIPEPKVTELAEGHIYSGQDALTLGLVDEIGGIPSAIEWMKTKLGVSSVQVVFGPKPKTPLLWRLLGSQTGISSPASVPVLVEELAKSYLGQVQGRPQAMMEDVRGV